MSLVQTTPAIRKFALILAYWMGQVLQLMQTSDRPDFTAVENVAKELERYAHAYDEALENKWAALAEATQSQNVRLPSDFTETATASASAMQAMVEDNKCVAVQHAAKAWMLGVKSILPISERRISEAAALEGTLFLAIAGDVDTASKMFASREQES
jgi:hypothetical protein